MIFLKLFKESILFAWHALSNNKLRTLLSLLGITIGIFAIISVFTLVDSLERNVRGSINSLGDDVVYIQKWPWVFSADFKWWEYMNRPIPTYREAELLAKRLNSVEAMAYEGFLNGKVVKHANNSVENTTVAIVSHAYDRISSFELAEGRYFSEMESQTGKPIALIGADVKESLFPNKSAIGEEINLLGRKVTVIGVFEKEGSSIMDNSKDNFIVLPVYYARNVVDLNSERTNPLIAAKAKPNVSISEMKDELRGQMRAIRRIKPSGADDFSLNEAKLLANTVTSTFDVLGIAGWIIGGFSILVGGFGIANIMFVSVKERTNVIGIQKSLGAKNYFILLQFLIESVFLCLMGGTLGLLMVFIFSVIATNLADFDFVLTIGNIFQGLLISAIIGVVSGFVPAFTASRMDPVEAIRTGI